MKIFKIGSQITQTVKNVGRLKTILTVMGKHGLSEIAERIRLTRMVPNFVFRRDREKEKLTLPERFRSAFEELGPTFVKLGQVLSTRPDLIPQEFVEEFEKLQDDVAPVSFSLIKETVEKELGGPISKIFKSFHEKPLASASIAQVHEADLQDGTKVVVKVQRPGIDKMIDTDVSILFVIAGLAEKYIEQSKTFNPKGIVEEFFKSLKKELDFIVEAGNMTRIRKNFEENENIIIPLVYREFTTTKILTLEKLEGLRLSDKTSLEKAGIDVQKITHTGVQVFYKMVLIDGLFHGDLHAGNIFILKDNRIGFVDFGIVGRLNQKTRDSLCNMFLAFVTEDYDALVYEYCEMAMVTNRVDMDHFSRQVRELVEPYYGLPLKEVNVGKMLLDLTVIASQHHLKMSQDLMLLFRALLTIEGMGHAMNPDFDVIKEMGEFGQIILKAKYDPRVLSKELLTVLRDSSGLLKLLPRQLKQIMKKVVNNEISIQTEVSGLKEFQASLMRGRQLMSLAILIASIVVSSTIILIFHKNITIMGFSVFGLMGLGFAAFLSFIYLVSYFKK